MIIKSVKDLEKIIKLCKKQGINAIKVGNIEFSLELKPTKPIDTDVFPEASIKIPQFNGRAFDDTPDVITTDELTDDQRLFYSSKEEPGSIEADT